VLARQLRWRAARPAPTGRASPPEGRAIITPHGEWAGWYFSEELKFAKEQGYDITIYRGYHFNQHEYIFKDYIDQYFKIKADASASDKSAPFGGRTARPFGGADGPPLRGVLSL